MNTLNFSNGDSMPVLGLGTWLSKPTEVYEAVVEAVKTGYRHIDCAYIYKNEKEIGKALKYLFAENIVKREEMFITSKLWNNFHSPEQVEPAIRQSLKDLQLDYLDLYLIHWPLAFKKEHAQTSDDQYSLDEMPLSATWKAMEGIKEMGLAKHIGVSNFTKEQMEEAEKYCAIEVYQPQYSMVDRKWEQLIRWACAQKMGVMTYGTLGGGILTGKYRELKEYGVDDNRNRFYPYFKEPLFSKVMLLLRTMDQISEKRNVPLSQIALNWTLQRPFISSCIIGAQSRDKIEENCKVFEWKLSDDEMQLLEQALKNTII